MGRLVDGVWRTSDELAAATDGRFHRSTTQFRDWIRADPQAEFPAESGRYHLYVSLACPWAHRAVIVRKLKRLEGAISMSEVSPLMYDDGWAFTDEFPDHANQARLLRDLYVRARPDYSGRVTVPVLWDKRTAAIVNNESAEIIRMFNGEFRALSDDSSDFYPEPLRGEIDEINEIVYHAVNNGVYKAGFARTQEAHDEAVGAVFDALDQLEARLTERPYLIGDAVTEADWRLFTTLVRFDPVYTVLFKCNRRRLIDYPALWRYARALYAVPGVADTVNLDRIKRHYYTSLRSLNPRGLIPTGPDVWL